MSGEDQPVVARPRVLALGDSDTRLKWAVRLARAIPEADVACRSLDTRQALSARQVDEIGLDDHAVVSLSTVRNAAVTEEYDVVVACMTGGELHRLRRAAETRYGKGPRPLFVTGYAVVVSEYHL